MPGRIVDGPAGIERGLQLRDRSGVGEVALVVLDGERNPGQIVPVLRHVLVEVLHRLDVGVHPLDLAVRHEDDAVHPLEDQLAGSVVVHLAGHGIQMELHLETPDGAEIDRQEIEEERALGLGRQRDHLPPRAGGHLVVDVFEVGGLAAESRPVVDELAVDFTGRVVDHRHALHVPSGSEEFVDLVFRLAEKLGLDARRARPLAIEHLGKDLAEHGSTAEFTRSLTSPSVVRLSNSTTRMTRRATSARYIDCPGSTRAAGDVA